MAASKSMLESLLARVRQRSNEPRQRGYADAAPASETAQTSPPPVAARPAPVVAAVVEEEVEEYDDELIEIIDDDEVTSDSEPPPPSEPASAPLELRASAPSVEMRRRALPPSARPLPAAAPRAAAPAVAAVPAVAPAQAPSGMSAVAALRAEVVARRPIPTAPVVQTQATRPDPRGQSFLQLLDASLDLGK